MCMHNKEVIQDEKTEKRQTLVAAAKIEHDTVLAELEKQVARRNSWMIKSTESISPKKQNGR